MEDWRPVADGHGDGFGDEPVYTRLSYSTTERVEKVLGELMGGERLDERADYRICDDLYVRLVRHTRRFSPCQSKESMHFQGGGISWHERSCTDYSATEWPCLLSLCSLLMAGNFDT